MGWRIDILVLIGLDPGLRFTGWGVIRAEGNHLQHVAHGVISIPVSQDLAGRLADLHKKLSYLITEFKPHEAAVEETFVNRNAASTLKLGQARGVAMAVPALAGLPVSEYSATRVKKSLVGSGHAKKCQVKIMVRHLLAGLIAESSDATDALAVAICHAHYRSSAVNPALAKGVE